MPDTGRRRAALAILLLLLAVVPQIAAVLAMPDLVTLASQVAIFAIAAISLDLLIGYTGLSSFGHAAFFGLGGYTVAILAHETIAADAAIAWPAAILVAALAAAIIGAMSLRTTGISFIMITLAFAEMFFFLFVSLKAYGGDDGLGFRRRNEIPGIGPRDDVAFYYVCLAALLAVFFLCARLVKSRFGIVLQGIRQNERRMAAIGLSTYRYKLVAFTIAGAGAGLAGALYANLLRFVSPDMLHWTMSGDLMIMVVLGGSGTLVGPILGAAALVCLQSWLAQWTEHWMIVMGPVLVVVILYARRGLWGLVGG